MGLLRRLYGKGSASPISPPESKSEAGGIELKSWDPLANVMQAFFSMMAPLCGHPVTGLRVVDLVPVAPTLAQDLERIERAQLSQALTSVDPAEVESEVEALQVQVEEDSDDARLWLKGVAWDARREAAVALSRMGTRGEASAIPRVTRGYMILAMAAVRDSDPDRRVDAIVALKRVMLDTSAETLDMDSNLIAGLLLSWLLAEDPDERVRLAASWVLGGIPYRNVQGAPIAWLAAWHVLRQAEHVREGRIATPDDSRRQLFALAAQAEAAHDEWLVKMSRQAVLQVPSKLTEITGKAVTTAGGTAHEGIEFSSWPSLVEQALLGSPGVACFSRFATDKGPPLTCMVVREDREHLQAIPVTPSVAVRSRLFLRSGVALVSVIAMVEGARYETWWNYHSPIGRDWFADITKQEPFGICFYVERPEPERVVWVLNPLQHVFAGYVADIERLDPWPSDAFDRERANLFRDFTGVASLWEAMGWVRWTPS